MEMVAPVPAVDFNFDSACSSPYMTAPSSPQRFGNFLFSAPSSPTHVSSLYPFQWEEKRKSNHDDDDDGGHGCEEDFEFNFSGHLEIPSLSAADELFDGGKIRPLKPPPGYDESFSSAVSSPKSKRQHGQNDIQFGSQQRGRERTSAAASSSSSTSSACNYVHKKSRSLSPLRVSGIMFEQEETSSNSQKNNESSTANNPKSSYVSSLLSSISFSKVNKKWKLKDLLLFRSASEGRAASKDPLRKYALLSRKEAEEEVKNASFRSTDSMGSVSSSRRRGRVSAHELHYTANRAVSEEMKRKTFLPYKQGLLGCLGFNPGMHEISRGIGSLTRGSS
ncbi:hypothetical protein ERO13_D12G025300v2 [Gossypium hirsutum]|uniref:Uncharacterized protein n=1 Tax=Gossypium hirsutum TaxID=3635 RepID=A0A1U8NZ14_GOSHI|nr:uncharacterized protein LOC107953405 [Gossypium hirsutum]KAG4114109.1 hypothetical protein ERO13_D12G025300v2 [Gossypium hirsutum]